MGIFVITRSRAETEKRRSINVMYAPEIEHTGGIDLKTWHPPIRRDRDCEL